MDSNLTFLERLSQLGDRLALYLQQEPVRVLIELVILWLVVYTALEFLKGSRGERMVKAVAVVLVTVMVVLKFAGGGSSFERLGFLAEKFLAWAAFALAIVFQPELRRALARLGEARIFGGGHERKARVIEEILGATEYLAKHKIGMLVAVERQVGLGGVIEAGTRLDAQLSRELLKTIFWPGSALHDLGVVIRGDRIEAAAVQFPLAEGESIRSELGSRHRSAIGLTMETDALVVVVSEETGTISVADRGRLIRNLTIDSLREYLDKALAGVAMSVGDGALASMETNLEKAGVDAPAAPTVTSGDLESGEPGTVKLAEPAGVSAAGSSDP